MDQGRDIVVQDHVARLERLLVLAAYIVQRHGALYGPYLDRIEKELVAARANDPVARARRILDAYSRPRDGGMLLPAPDAPTDVR
jgi:hypothetical protein